jgi:hypothetical protein
LKDKRKHHRINEDLGIAITVDPETGDDVPRLGSDVLLARNVSKGGLQFRYGGNMTIGSKLRIRVALKSPLKAILHVGRVRWVGPNGPDQRRTIGVEFIETRNSDMWDWLQHLGDRAQAKN